MTMFIHCKTCGGRYNDVLPDHTRYFHACAAEWLVTVTRAGADIEVALTATKPGDVEKSRRQAERANPRDENIQATGATPSAVKSEGGGVLSAATKADLDALVAAEADPD